MTVDGMQNKKIKGLFVAVVEAATGCGRDLQSFTEFSCPSMVTFVIATVIKMDEKNP